MDENHSTIQCDDIKKIIAVLPEYIKRIEKVEEKQELQDKVVNELVSSHAETRIYVKMILEKVGSLEGNLFSYMKQAVKDVNKERMEDRILDNAERNGQAQERMKDKLIDHEQRLSQNTSNIKMTEGWQALIKYVVGATIGVLVTGAAAYFTQIK